MFHAGLYGRRSAAAQQSGRELSPEIARFRRYARNQESELAEDREKLSTGPNEEPINETAPIDSRIMEKDDDTPRPGGE